MADEDFLGGTKINKRTQNQLKEFIGWTKLREKIDPSNFIFSLEAPQGHLPILPLGSVITPKKMWITLMLWNLLGKLILLHFLHKIDLEVNKNILIKSQQLRSYGNQKN